MKTIFAFSLFAGAVLLAACGRTDLGAEDMIPEDGGADVTGDACPPTQTECGGACIDVSSDPANCGGCNISCASTQTCTGGQCLTKQCPAGKTLCGDTCVDVTTDGKNCGACGTACPDTEVCLFGSCALTCDVGLAKCNGGCVDLLKDHDNCGGCGKTCAVDETCASGLCCGAGESNCSGVCADTQNDPQHCGTCTTKCGQGESCNGGQCGSCSKTVLVLSDSDASANAALKTALTNAGFTPTLIAGGVVTYAGNPAPSGFGAVLVSNGEQWNQDMNASGQTAIVNAQQAGDTGVVFTEWAAWMPTINLWKTLRQLVLLQHDSGVDSTLTFDLKVNNHPIWKGLPTTFTTVNKMGANVGATLLHNATEIAGCSECKGPGVAVLDEQGKGRIVHIAHAASYQGGGKAWSNDTNTTTMLTNAVGWAAKCL